MNCNCIKKYSEDLKKHFVGNVENIKIETTFIMRGDMMQEITCTPVSYIEKKTSKNGNIREIKKKTKIIHKYCPFCGKKYEE